MNKKKILKTFFITVTVALLLIAIGFGIFIYKFSSEPFLDDGPFVGLTRSNCQLTNPVSEININNRFTLQSFKPVTREESPTVRLIDTSQNIIWCIYADGYEKTSVSDVDFSSFEESGYDRYLVKGSVRWTYGHERALWYIGKDGKLIEYWYSW